MCIMNILPLFTQGTIMDTYHNFTDLDTALVLVVLTIIAIAVYKLVHRFRKSSESAEDDYSNNESPPCSINEEDNFNKEKTMNVNTKPLNSDHKYAGMDTPTLVKAILKDLNCKYEESDDHSDYMFSYQGENFVARAPDKHNPRIRIFDLDWYHCPLSNLEEMSCMQKAINAANTRQMCTAVYYIDNDRKEMSVYSKADFLIWSDMSHPDNYMRMWLGNLFYLKQNVVVDVEKEKQRIDLQ